MTLSRFGIRLQRYFQRNAASVWFRKRLVIRTPQPLISFTFDDFPRSALLTGGTILNRFGAVGTYYASLGLVGKETPSGFSFVSSDLKTLLQQGHELGCHTYSHCHSWKTKTAIFERAIIENRVALSQLVPCAEFKTFSYPVSSPRPMTKRTTAKYFLCCRGGGQTLNAGTADLNQLSAFFLEKNRDRIDTVKDLIDLNQDTRGWLIFATHDVSRDPSPFGCTPEFFEEVVQYSVNSGACILPVVRGLKVLRERSFGQWPLANPQCQVHSEYLKDCGRGRGGLD